MKKFLFLFALASCEKTENKAIAFAKALDPMAVCTELTMGDDRSLSSIDTATCKVGHELWFCSVDLRAPAAPNCRKIRDIPVEKQP